MADLHPLPTSARKKTARGAARWLIWLSKHTPNDAKPKRQGVDVMQMRAILYSSKRMPKSTVGYAMLTQRRTPYASFPTLVSCPDSHYGA